VIAKTRRPGSPLDDEPVDLARVSQVRSTTADSSETGPSTVRQSLPHLGQQVPISDPRLWTTGCHLNLLVASNLSALVYIILKHRGT
jgi:hypothetical protein